MPEGRTEVGATRTPCERWLVVGLGNPGPAYQTHRHNIGYRVAEEVADRCGAGFRADRSGRAEIAEGRLGPPGPDGVRVVVTKPRCYMNEVGGPVSTVSRFFSIAPACVIAVHDELDLPFGHLRVKFGGGDNGHNGLRSLRSALGTGDFYRVRVGIGRPPGRQPVADFVLSAYSRAEAREVPVHVAEAADAIESLVSAGLDRTQSLFNR